MDENGLFRLTEKEKEALRLIFSHRSLDAIARQLDISKSAVQRRLASAYAKLGTQDRFAIGRLLAAHEGWAPYTDRTDTNDQVGEPAAPAPHGATGSAVQLLDSLAALLGRTGPNVALSAGQKVLRTLLIALITLIILSVLAASMGALGNFGQGLAKQGIHQI